MIAPLSVFELLSEKQAKNRIYAGLSIYIAADV